MPRGVPTPARRHSNHLLPFPSSGCDQCSPQTLRDAPRVRHRQRAGASAQALTARHGHWYRGAIVRGGRKGFASGAASRPRCHPPGVADERARARAAALLAGGCGGGTRQDAGEPAGTFAMRIVAREVPRRADDRPPDALDRCWCATPARTRCPTWPSPSTPSTTPPATPNWRPTNARCGWSNGAPERSPPRRSKARKSARPAAARPPTSTPGRSARSRPARRARSSGTSCLSSQACIRSTTASRAGLSGKAKARLPSGRPGQRQFLAHIAAAPPLTHVNPNTGHVEVGQFPASP